MSWNGRVYPTLFDIVRTAYHARGGKHPDLPGGRRWHPTVGWTFVLPSIGTAELYLLTKSDGVIRKVVGLQ